MSSEALEKRLILSYVFILRNKYFRSVAVKDLKFPFWFVLANIYSILVYVSYPLITQAYLDIMYTGKGVVYLKELTFIFLAIFFVKIFIDIFVKRLFDDYITRLEVRIKKLVFRKYKSNLKVLLESKQDLLASNVHLYVMLVKTLYYNLVDILKIIFVFVIILVSKREFFIYFLAAIPFFILFYFIQLKILDSEVKLKSKSKSRDYGLLLKKISDDNIPYKKANAMVINFFSDILDRRKSNKKKQISMNVVIDSFVGFYRIFFLAYFTSFFILYKVSLPGLVVGLLFITLLARPFLNIIKSVPTRVIARKAFFRINSLMK